MSSLGKALDKLEPQAPRATAPVASGFTGATPLPSHPVCLEIIIDEENAWELPWASFYGAQIKPERLLLSFLRFEVMAEGAHLGKLRKYINDLSLAELRQVADGFEESAGKNGSPVVRKITVTPTSAASASQK
jgi:hypothetical protein